MNMKKIHPGHHYLPRFDRLVIDIFSPEGFAELRWNLDPKKCSTRQLIAIGDYLHKVSFFNRQSLTEFQLEQLKQKDDALIKEFQSRCPKGESLKDFHSRHTQ